MTGLLDFIRPEIKALPESGIVEVVNYARTKKDLGAQTIINVLVEQAGEGRKHVSMTSTKVRDVLAGRFGGGKVARKIGIEVMHRAVKLCPSLQVRPERSATSKVCPSVHSPLSANQGVNLPVCGS